MEKLMNKTIFFLVILFACCTHTAFANGIDYAERYKEQKVYWDRVYNDIEESYGDGYQVNLGLITTPPAAGSTVWAPMVYHIAILEDGLSDWEKERYKDLYKKTKFPIYCGYVIFGHDKSFTFVKKTYLPIESVTEFYSVPIVSPPIEEDRFFWFNMGQYVTQKIKVIELFCGIYGMDFVPQFKHQYPYGQPPEGLDREELFQLENHVSFERERSNGPSQ